MNNYEELYFQYLPMIHKLSRKYLFVATRCSIEFDDLVQVGAIALLYSINNYDEQKGVPFTFYLYQNIEFHIKREITRLNEYIDTTPLEDYKESNVDVDVDVGVNLENQILDKATYDLWKDEIIKSLPQLWSKGLILKVFHNKSVKEISIELQLDKVAVNRMIHKSKSKLLRKSKVIREAYYHHNKSNSIDLFRRPHDVIYLL